MIETVITHFCSFASGLACGVVVMALMVASGHDKKEESNS